MNHSSAAESEVDGVAVDRHPHVVDVTATQVLLVVAGAAATVATVLWCWALVGNRHRGLDASDESYYLLSALHPGDAVARQSNFGFYLNAMLRGSGGTIGGLRLMGILLLLACTAGGAAVLARSADAPNGWVRWSVAAGMWMSLSAAAFTYYSLWLVTPSYNHLSLCAGLVVVTALFGVVTVESTPSDSRKWHRLEVGFIVLGWSLAVLFDVKATSAIAMFALVLVTIIAATGWRRLLLGVPSMAIGGLAGLLTSVIVAGAPTATVRGLSRYASMLESLASHSTAEVWETEFLRETVAPWLCWYALAAVAVALVRRHVGSCRVVAVVMLSAMGVVSVWLWTERVRGGPVPFATNGWWWFRLTAWALLFTTVLAPRWSRVLLVGPLLSLAALLVASGSNNGFIRQTSFLAALYVFSVLAQAIVVRRERQRELFVTAPAAVFVIVVSIASMLVIGDAMREPYRLDGPLSEQTTQISLPGLGTIRTSPDMAESVESLASLSSTIPGDALRCTVDLSGDWPLSLLALDARSATNPWVAGGFKGSAAAYEYLTQYAPCLDGQVLLIESPEGSNRIRPPKILEGRAARRIGEVRVRGAADETLVLFLVEPKNP